MFKKIIEHFKKLDWILILIPIFLSIFGIAIQFSIAGNNQTNILNGAVKQIIFLFVGVIVMFVLSFYEYRSLVARSNYLYIFLIILLFLILIVGSLTRGARSWFDFGFFKLQPTEFLKIVTILFLSFFWASYNRKNVLIKDIFLSILIMLPSLILILLQPDFGSFILILLLTIFFIFIVNTNIKQYLVFFLILVCCVTFFWTIVFKDYQKTRIMSFLNPVEDSLGSGYQVAQSMIAIGSGGFYGKGFGFGAQSQLNFLPENTNDFIFAAISEEFGFIGSCVILVLYFVFFLRLFFIIKNLSGDLPKFILLGASFLLFLEVFINIGMNLGLAPVTGISLPFVSYGGSGLVSSFLIVGILQNIIVSQKRF